MDERHLEAALAASRTALECAENLAHRALDIADAEGYANRQMMLDAMRSTTKGASDG